MIAQDGWAPAPSREHHLEGSITSTLPSYATAPVGWGNAAPSPPAAVSPQQPTFSSVAPPTFAPGEQIQSPVMPTWSPPMGPTGPTFAGPPPQYAPQQPGYLPPTQGYGQGPYQAPYQAPFQAPQKSSAGKTVGIVIACVIAGLLVLSVGAIGAVSILGTRVKTSFNAIPNTLPAFNSISNTLPAYDEYSYSEPVAPAGALDVGQAPALFPTNYEAGIGLVSTDLIIRNTNGPVAEYSSCVTFEPNTANYVAVPCAAPHNGEFVVSLSGRTKAEVAENCVQNAVSLRPLTTPENVWLVEYPSGVTECFLTAPSFDPTRFDELGTSAFS
jgi:Flp pilus assembly pilin Flp